MINNWRLKSLFEFWNDTVGHHLFHFMRHTGHGHEHFTLSVRPAGIFIKPHSWSCAIRVGNFFTRCWQSSLLTIDFSQFSSTAFKKLSYFAQSLFINFKVAVKIFCEKWFCKIIAGGAKTSCN